MIGSHNTMTYLPAESKAWEAIACWWRCQEKTLDEQIAAGVRWFDIRVAYNKTPGEPLWKFAHGGVDLKVSGKVSACNADVRDGTDYETLASVLEKIGRCGGVARLMLERGDESDEELFAEYFAPSRIGSKWPCIIGAVIKKDWKVLWGKRNDLGITDCSYVPYKRDTDWWEQLKGIIGFPWKSIKKRALKGRRPALSEKNDNAWVWVYDYV